MFHKLAISNSPVINLKMQNACWFNFLWVVIQMMGLWVIQWIYRFWETSMWLSILNDTFVFPSREHEDGLGSRFFPAFVLVIIIIQVKAGYFIVGFFFYFLTSQLFCVFLKFNGHLIFALWEVSVHIIYSIYQLLLLQWCSFLQISIL